MSSAAPVLHLINPVAPLAQAEPKALVASRSRSDRNRHDRRPLGQFLLDLKAVEPGNLLKALALRDRQEARLGDILLTHGWVSEDDLMTALTLQWRARSVDLTTDPPDARLLDRLGAAFCLAEGIIPWRQIGGVTVIATARPEDFTAFMGRLPADFGPVLMALTQERDIHQSIVRARETRLIRMAEAQTPGDLSCRTQDSKRAARIAMGGIAALAVGMVLLPRPTFGLLAVIAITSLVLFTALKVTAFVASVFGGHRPRLELPLAGPKRLPVVSVMVPLFRETDIAARLIQRLGRINYPKELLDILLVVEETDDGTRAALAKARLPRWMRIVTVPKGPIQTKPRALNYALDFCEGAIIGVWDAEDAPAADQVFKVVRQFHNCPPEVACLQGVLDYYDARHNWLSRCFTIEYAALFRTILPGFARLGLVLPLGGTTLFFRRAVLESLGRWDAHNVTEDADLGVRLARAGYRTEMLSSVTEEEPNCRALPWIRQRSRWLKGFAMTWASHNRNPARLWRDLGPWRFFGVQVFFLGTLSQFLLAPVLWSFWLLLFDLPHPLRTILAPGVVTGLSVVFIAAELCNIGIALWSVRGPGHRHLLKWVPGMPFYFPLAAIAAYKAVYEWVVRPYYWDKTAHGIIATGLAEADVLPTLLLSDPVGFSFPPNSQAPQPPTAPSPRLTPVQKPQIRPSARSAVADPARGPGIEFQPCFEGFGDM